jgi:flagellar biosynthesis GTPase FlhF
MRATACCLAAVLLSVGAPNAAAGSDQDGVLVAEWLQQIDLPPAASAEYAERVREEAVDVAMFGELLDDSEGLRALGVSNALHRARIVARWRERPAATAPLSSSTEHHTRNNKVDAQPAPIPQPLESDPAMDADKARPDKARPEQEQLADERAEQEQLAGERAEQEQRADKRAEQEQLADKRADQERLADERADQERLADERADQERLADERAEQEQAGDQVEQEQLPAKQGNHEPVVAGQARQRLTVTLHGRSGVHFTTAGNDTVVVTAVHANSPAARAGLATGWRVATVSGTPCKGVLSLQRVLADAEDSENSSAVELELDPPSTVTNLDKKARRKLQKRGNAAAKKLRGVCGGRHDVDATSEFHRLAVSRSTFRVVCLGIILQVCNGCGLTRGAGADCNACIFVTEQPGYYGWCSPHCR